MKFSRAWITWKEAPGLFKGYPEKRVLAILLILLFSTAFSSAANLNLGILKRIDDLTLSSGCEVYVITITFQSFMKNAEKEFITPGDIKAIQSVADVKNALPLQFVFDRFNRTQIAAMPVDSDFLKAIGFKMSEGRMFNEKPAADGTLEAAAISRDSYNQIFAGVPLRFAHIQIHDTKYSISGILEPNIFTLSSHFSSPDVFICFIPRNSGFLAGIEPHFLAMFMIPNTPAALNKTIRILNMRHPGSKYEGKSLNYETRQDFSRRLDVPIRIAWLFVICSAAIAMLGITGVLVLALAERYPDLARMRLLGATKTDVFIYIVANLLFISFVPAVAGTAVGFRMALYLSKFFEVPFTMQILLTPRLALVFAAPFVFALTAAVGPTISLLRKDPVTFYINR